MQASCVRDHTRRWSAALRGTAELARIAEMRWATGGELRFHRGSPIGFINLSSCAVRRCTKSRQLGTFGVSGGILAATWI